jgi:enoyl-CoA hydratase
VDHLLVDVADRIATVTLNRPDKRNALSTALRAELHATLTALDGDEAVDVVIITGADPAFSAGVDLKELSGGGGGGGGGGSVGPPVPDMATPLLGAVNGVAVTGGLEVALRCDVLVASDRARFADTHARVGLLPTWGLTTLLPAAVGPKKAREMSITGNYVDADEALRIGLVQHVVPHDELLPFTHRLAADIASNDDGAVRRLLEVYDEVADLPRAEAFAHEQAAGVDWIRRSAPSAERTAAVMKRGREQQGS